MDDGVMRTTPQLVIALATLLLAGCAGRALMGTPNVYAGAEPATVYRDVPGELQSNKVDLLYVTDRAPERDGSGKLGYGFGRSASLAIGSIVVQIGKAISWDELMELSRRLTLAPKAEVVIYIHGYNNKLSDAALTLGELWHFLGREHVPVLYSWPAGHGGISGYAYDRESGEFTIYHLKSFLRLLAALPELDRVHIIAHSRGTDVAITALRELFLETLAEGEDPRQRFHIRNLILAAPDMDFEVLVQRVVAEHLERGLVQVTLYTYQKDKAIHVAERLFGSHARLGRLQQNDLSKEDVESLEKVPSITFVEFTGKSKGLSHGYFHTSPAVSSDLILSIRYEMPPGPQHGRPMQRRGTNFWAIDDSYPSNAGEH